MPWVAGSDATGGLVDIFEIFPEHSHMKAFIYRSCYAKGFCSKINILEGKF